VGSAITFSGFNDIDFSVVLNAIMSQESQPLVALQSRQSAMKSRATTFGTLVTHASALQSAAKALSDPTSIASFKATSNDPTAVAVSAGGSAIPGRYEIVVNELARSQVMASSSSTIDADTTIVASTGSLVIGGHTVSLTGAVTLKQLAQTINDDSAAPVRASVVQAGPASFRLVLTGKSTGAANAFTVQNSLGGGSGVTFTDTDGDLTSGDDALDNAVSAIDASLLVNNIAITSSSNNLDTVIPGSTITLFKKGATAVIDISEDSDALKTKLKDFISSYNDFVKFANDQAKSATSGDAASIGRDPLLRQLRSSLRGALNTQYVTGGPFEYLSQIGVEFTQTGTLDLNEARFAEAMSGGTADVAALLAGTTGTPGALASMSTMLKEYTKSSGILLGARDQLTAAADRLSSQIASMEARLALRRLSLQQEFTAADAAMARLKNQSGNLASLGAGL
jgi:flagellar hook-associated protein 2